MIGLSSRIVVEDRDGEGLLAAWTPLKGVSFPVNFFDAASGSAPLVRFHEAVGAALAAMTEEQRSRAYASVQIDDDGSPYLRLGYYQVESEAEFDSRIATKKAEKDRYEADHLVRRRQMYEELKLEFEGLPNAEVP